MSALSCTRAMKNHVSHVHHMSVMSIMSIMFNVNIAKHTICACASACCMCMSACAHVCVCVCLTMCVLVLPLNNPRASSQTCKTHSACSCQSKSMLKQKRCLSSAALLSPKYIILAGSHGSRSLLASFQYHQHGLELTSLLASKQSLQAAMAHFLCSLLFSTTNMALS